MNELKVGFLNTSKLATGIPGMGDILHGGFVKGGVYLLLGPPGTGKTIFANQICFNHASKSKENVVYVTLLAESHGRMMENLSTLNYFKESDVSNSIHYMGGYGILEKEGLKGFLRLLAGIVKEKKASILMIDGMSTIGELEESPITFRKFTHELNSYISSSGCTAFLLSSNEGHFSKPEHTMVDGIINFHYTNEDSRAIRQIEVRKFRGSGHAYGMHQYKIDETGIIVYPRLEETVAGIRAKFDKSQKLTFDVPGLDEMLGGCPYLGTTMTFIGPAGTGKTCLALQFLQSGAMAGQKGLYFGFYENPEELINKSQSLGMDLPKSIKKGMVEILWNPQLEQEMDELATRLLNKVRSMGATRVVIDGVDGLRGSVAHPDRLDVFMVALVRKLKSLGVTTLIIEETSLFGVLRDRTIAEHSAINENVLYFHYVDINEKVVTALTVLKMRNCEYDRKTRELIIARKGLSVGPPILSSQTTLTDNPRPHPGAKGVPKKKGVGRK